MNTPHAPRPTGLLHHSVRTAITTNVDPGTGAQQRTLTTSRLELRWIGGELAVRFSATAFDMNADRLAQRNRERRMQRRA